MTQCFYDSHCIIIIIPISFILDHDILNKVSEEFNNFNKIMESIFILSENNILNEGAKLDKIKETILHTLERIKAFFIKVGSVIIQWY